MKIKRQDFNPSKFRKLYASWTPEQKQNYHEEQKRKLIFERGRRAIQIQAKLEP